MLPWVPASLPPWFLSSVRSGSQNQPYRTLVFSSDPDVWGEDSLVKLLIHSVYVGMSGFPASQRSRKGFPASQMRAAGSLEGQAAVSESSRDTGHAPSSSRILQERPE